MSCKTHKLSVSYTCTFPSPYNNFNCYSIPISTIYTHVPNRHCSYFLIMCLWPMYISRPLYIITSIVAVLQSLLSANLVLCTCTKQALFLVMSLWPISQPLYQLQLLQYSELQMAKTIIEITNVGVYHKDMHNVQITYYTRAGKFTQKLKYLAIFWSSQLHV